MLPSFIWTGAFSQRSMRGTLALAVLAAWAPPSASQRQVLTLHARAWSGFAPPICRMPPRQASGPPPTGPRRRSHPRFRHRLVGFDTSSAVRFRSPLRTIPDEISSCLLLQRSPRSLLTTAARSGLRPTPDCRPQTAASEGLPPSFIQLHTPVPVLPAGRVRDTPTLPIRGWLGWARPTIMAHSRQPR